MGNSGGNTGWELLQPASVPVDQFTILFPALECVCVRPDHETAGMPLKKCAPSRIKFAPWCYIVYAQREPNPQVGIPSSPMSALGQKQTLSLPSEMSAIPPKADIDPSAQNVRF